MTQTIGKQGIGNAELDNSGCNSLILLDFLQK